MYDNDQVKGKFDHRSEYRCDKCFTSRDQKSMSIEWDQLYIAVGRAQDHGEFLKDNYLRLKSELWSTILAAAVCFNFR